MLSKAFCLFALVEASGCWKKSSFHLSAQWKDQPAPVRSG